MRFRLEFLILAQKRQITFNCWYRWHNFKTQLSITVIQLRLNINNVVLICADSWMRMWNTDPWHGSVTLKRVLCLLQMFLQLCDILFVLLFKTKCMISNTVFYSQVMSWRHMWQVHLLTKRSPSYTWLIDWLRFYKWTRTIRVLYGLQVELFIFLKAADVSLLLQVFRPVEDVLLRGFVGNHFWSVCLTLLRVSRWETCWQSKPPDWLR